MKKEKNVGSDFGEDIVKSLLGGFLLIAGGIIAFAALIYYLFMSL